MQDNWCQNFPPAVVTWVNEGRDKGGGDKGGTGGGDGAKTSGKYPSTWKISVIQSILN